ncbi:hypothetical protein TNCV_4358401 [Trichonephila clavipes]|nr:hypothetical protein TNCV_4358401 [Trichonephila clavipes]
MQGVRYAIGPQCKCDKLYPPDGELDAGSEWGSDGRPIASKHQWSRTKAGEPGADLLHVSMNGDWGRRSGPRSSLDKGRPMTASSVPHCPRVALEFDENHSLTSHFETTRVGGGMLKNLHDESSAALGLDRNNVTFVNYHFPVGGFCEGDTRNRWRDGQVCPDVDKELWRLGPDGSGVFWRWTSVSRCGQGTLAPWARRLGRPGGKRRKSREKRQESPGERTDGRRRKDGKEREETERESGRESEARLEWRKRAESGNWSEKDDERRWR